MRKVFIGTTVIFFLLGCVTVYGSASPNSTLSDWYGNTFQKEKELLQDEISDLYTASFKQVKEEMKEKKEDLTAGVMKARENSITTAKEEINKYNQSYMNALDEKKDELLDDNFQEEKKQLEEKIISEIEQDTIAILTDLLN
ncbi:hypothetical protein [Ornithinibacillus halophilus]|uniref:Uncharacterized protein n=1 Tax=Ornithinibacillus halophilus TaxID=930117 RepID=A0A1M5HL46_9BACI|nr:hypothetical protein [Ornithinibacillus halophilus]SHG16696.1 hypothetical protein SAMN05216225_101830 [Ornithinibacillus halophilus]